MTIDERQALLQVLPSFRNLPPTALQELVMYLQEISFPAGEVVVRQGDKADGLYVIQSGRGEVSVLVKGESAPKALAVLHAGEIFGELAFLKMNCKRSATVTALEPLKLMVLQGAAFLRFLKKYPSVRPVFAATAEELRIYNFLKLLSPFQALEQRRLHLLCDAVRTLIVPAGQEILRQGEAGKSCYLIRSGRAEVFRRDAAGLENSLAVLSEGALFGEEALVTEAPRNATVTALEDCKLYVLSKADFMRSRT